MESLCMPFGTALFHSLFLLVKGGSQLHLLSQNVGVLYIEESQDMLKIVFMDGLRMSI